MDNKRVKRMRQFAHLHILTFAHLPHIYHALTSHRKSFGTELRFEFRNGDFAKVEDAGG